MGDLFFKDVPDLGKNAGLFIWRIEKLQPVLQTGKHSLGKFHTGDSYIVLSIYMVKNTLKMNIHFWLGSESSQDERGAAAILTAELDQKLGDLPVQFREMQGNESKEFIQLFPNGIQYVEGGVESGFKKVEHDVYETRLLQIKGRRNVRVVVCKVDVSSLNSGDVFILDAGLVLYQWNGKEASRAEKSKALDVTLAIKDEERGGRAKIVAINEGDTSEAAVAFFQALGHKGDLADLKIKDAAAGGSDDAPDAAGGPIKMYEAQDPKGQQWTLIEQRPLVKNMLKTESSFVFLGGGMVYAWVGKSCRADVRKNIITLSLAFAKRNNLPETTPVKVVKEGAEPPLFKQMFKEWDKPHIPRISSIEAMTPKQREKAVVDIEALVKQSKRDDDVPVDDGNGELVIWRVENFQRVAWPRDQYGEFYSGDSYIVLYKYKENGRRDAAIIYYWQGRDSSQDERASSALLAKQLDDEMGGYPVQVRVVQGKEPTHFFTLFKGRMVVHHGGKASGFKNVKDASEESKGKERALYHVRGTTDKNTHACQTVLEAASLNSGDCFILIIPGQRVYLWEGKYASPSERKFAHGVMASLAHDANVTAKGWVTVEEGSETDEFWEDIGGKGEYPSFVEGAVAAQEPRLFQICDAQVGGAGVKVEEIFNFTQDDLCEDDIMMLDTHRDVFLWIGRGANENEKAEAQNVAAKYVEAAAKTDGRDPDTSVMKITAGNEPTLFTCHFHGWDSKKAAAYVDPYEVKLAKIKAMKEQKQEKEEKAQAGGPLGTPIKAGVTPTKSGSGGTPFSTPTAAAAKAAPAEAKVATPAGSKVIPYEELVNMRLEDGIAPDLKETYLSEEEFKAVMGMDREAYAKLPKWKQADLKRKVRLF